MMHEAEIINNYNNGVKYPLAHRCIDQTEFNVVAQLQSVLQDPFESQIIWQKQHGVGLSIGYRMAVEAMHASAIAPKIELVSGEGDEKSWKTVAGCNVVTHLQKFRTLFAEQLDKRFQVTGCPDKHVLLALRMDPMLDTSSTGKIVEGKRAMLQLMEAEYIRALRYRYLHLQSNVATTVSKEVDDFTAAPAKKKKETEKEIAQPTTSKKVKKPTLMSKMLFSHAAPVPKVTETSAVEKTVEAEIEVYKKLCQVRAPAPKPQRLARTRHSD